MVIGGYFVHLDITPARLYSMNKECWSNQVYE